MKKLIALIIGISLISLSCEERTIINSNKNYQKVIITERNITPTVDIKNFTLITNNRAHDSVNARQILKLKRSFPLAMQNKDRSLFESILSDSFTFNGETQFFANKEDYINDRVNSSWTIDLIKYQNLVLQFFGETAVLSYRNSIDGTDSAGKPDIEYYDWADIYVKENGTWKIKSVHEIEGRVVYPK